MSNTQLPSPTSTSHFSKHRLEALTDGIYAVALTILVLEIKLPEFTSAAAALIGAHSTATWVNHHLIELLPRFFAWVLSFLILAVFWRSHVRVFQHVRDVNQPLFWTNVLQLLFASLVPFSSSLVGQYMAAFASTAVYAGNLIVIALLSLAQLALLRRYPELVASPMAEATRSAVAFRLWMLIAAGVLAMVIAWFNLYYGTTAFLLMIVAAAASRRWERRKVAATSANRD